ncbi:O-antigen ligase family protein [Candidatus Gottesmanbacteria bacterium]|nr:O-antigen ligase family protein [Candidatus Gottesmanbacteria bacterium]
MLFIITLVITMSRTAIGISYIFFLIFSIYLFKSFPKKKNIFLLLVLVFTLILAAPLNYYRISSLLSSVDTSLAERILLTKAAIIMIKNNFVFGVGINNFLFNLPSQLLLQPVHNTYLLILTESGIAGLILFVYILYKTWKNIIKIRGITKILLYITFLQILLLLLTDHYFYTLWQGQLIFVFFISFMLTKQVKYE